MKKLLIILGATSTGKTDLALKLAKKFNGELISCDSRQVYVGLDIGTGKMPSKFRSLKMKSGEWIVDNISIYLYDVYNPKKQYDVARYITKAEKVLEQIQKSGKLPIIVGGTGLYLKGLLYGFSNLGIPINLNLRKKLEKLSLQELQNKLQEIDVKKWDKMNNSDRQNTRRLIRAIELVVMEPQKRFNIYDLRIKNADILKIGLTLQRDILYERIDERVKKRIKMGMVEEAKNLHRAGLSLKRMRQLGLEYGVLADYLKKKITNEELIKILQRKIHAYARRQETWFKKEQQVSWFDITKKNYVTKVENLVAKWYYPYDATQN